MTDQNDRGARRARSLPWRPPARLVAAAVLTAGLGLIAVPPTVVASTAAATSAAAPQKQKQQQKQKQKAASDNRAAAQRAAKQKADRAARERAARQQAERAAKERAQRAARERAARQQADRAAKDRAQRAARDRAARQQAERAAKDRAQRAARDRAARQQAERAAKDRAQRAARDRATRQQADRAAKERAQRASRDRATRQQADRAAKERAQRDAQNRAVRDRAEKAERERRAVEQSFRDREADFMRAARERAAADRVRRLAKEAAAERARRAAPPPPNIRRTEPPALSRQAARREEVQRRRAELADQERARREWILKEQTDAARARAEARKLAERSASANRVSRTPVDLGTRPLKIAPNGTLAVPERSPGIASTVRPGTAKIAPNQRGAASALGTTPGATSKLPPRKSNTPSFGNQDGRPQATIQPGVRRPTGEGRIGAQGNPRVLAPATIAPIASRPQLIDPPIYSPETPVVPINVDDPIVIVEDDSSVTIYADDVDIIIDDPIVTIGCDNIWYEPAFFSGHSIHFGGWDHGWFWHFGGHRGHRYHSPSRRSWFGFRLRFGGWGFPYVRRYHHFDHFGYRHDPYSHFGLLYQIPARPGYARRASWSQPWRGWYEDVCRPRRDTYIRTVYVDTPVLTAPVPTVAEAWSEFSVGRAGRSFDMFDQILAVYPDDDDARLGRGMASARIGDFAPSATDLRRALALGPDPILRVPLDDGVLEQLGTVRLRANDHRRSGGNESNALLIIAVLRASLGEDAAAYHAIDRAIDLGEVSDAALGLRSELDRRLTGFD
ncbi:MAG: tetratricopeptide repeat protein [Phycisphaerales bacterium]